ncbi:MAG: dihydroorotase [Elusimicrobiota bacterium]|nr:dihydroorotase [Endomicrobiia bacterium]MDW8165886.1 dihydroorotase [Elusimicrobiota bacterium]
MKLLIKNAIVVEPSKNLEKKQDILIENGKIIEIKENIKLTQPHKQINANNFYVSAGFIDIHTHLREPGNEEEETINSGTKAAAAGGFTSVFCMPNTNPPIDDQAAVEFIMLKAKNEGLINVYPVGCVTKLRKGEELTEIGELKKAGVVAISDDGEPVENSKIMRRALEYSKMFNLPVIQHCEDKNLSKGGVINEGKVSTMLGVRGIPKESEEIIVIRDIILASLSKGFLHLTHISSKNSIEFIKQAKQKNINITCDVTPHHLVLTEDYLLKSPYDTNLKINPPLRTEEDRISLINAIKDDTVDCISSDHAPHTKEEKSKEFDLAPFGIIGLETLFPLCVTFLYYKHKVPLINIIKKITNNPAKIFNLKNKGKIEIGYDADLTIFSIQEEFIVSNFFSKSSNSPFIGWKLKGKIKYTICGGKVVFDSTNPKDPFYENKNFYNNKK